MDLQQMLTTHPKKPSLGEMGISDVFSCIRACFDCADACTVCADACLGEQMIQELVRCIRLNQDCADVCEATGKILTRQTEPSPTLTRSQLEACIIACRLCAEECEKHAQRHEHCRICAEACRRCEEECLRVLEKLPATAQAH